jgi:hypothetical protein
MEQQQDNTSDGAAPVIENAPTSASMPPEATVEAATPKNLLIVGVLAAIVVVLVLMYLWGSTLPGNDMALEQPAPPPAAPTEAPLSTSSDVTALEADLNATELDSIDNDLNALDKDLDTALQQ